MNLENYAESIVDSIIKYIGKPAYLTFERIKGSKNGEEIIYQALLKREIEEMCRDDGEIESRECYKS